MAREILPRGRSFRRSPGRHFPVDVETHVRCRELSETTAFRAYLATVNDTETIRSNAAGISLVNRIVTNPSIEIYAYRQAGRVFV